jgi:hypothetical protein
MRASAERKQLDRFLAKYSPEVASVAVKVLARMRERLPGAVEFVYDKTNSLVIGFGQTERPSEAIFSVALYRRWVNLYFLDGAALADPNRLLLGSGKQVRRIVVRDDTVLDDPGVRELMDDAVELAGAKFERGRPGRILIRLTVERR